MKNKLVAVVLLSMLSGVMYAQETKRGPVSDATKTSAPAKVSPADLAALSDLSDHIRLDNLNYQMEQEKAAQNDSIINEAQQLIAKRMASIPEVQKLKQQAEQDYAAFQEKMKILRTAAKLSSDWQVNTQTGEWVLPQASPVPDKPVGSKK